jgi:outer membrane protein OmpA-like peptidoglycan-associated protein
MYRTAALIAVSAFLLAGCVGYDDGDSRGDPRWVETHHDGETDYEFLDEVLFQTGSADLSSRAYDSVAAVADDIRRHSRAPIEVDGFTDTVGTHENNMALSQARAEAVASILVRNGVDQRRIVTHGLGETHLAVETGNNVSERRNRRVVIRLLSQ